MLALIAVGAISAAADATEPEPPPTWSLILPDGSIRLREHSLSFDPLTSGFYVYGGTQDSALNGALYRHLPSNWGWDSVTVAGLAPAPRRAHAAYFQRDRKALWIVGGETAAGKSDEIWEFSDTGSPHWTDHSGSSPSFAICSDLPQAYDTRRSRWVFFALSAPDTTHAQVLTLDDAPVW